jgi:hypothetical protein
MSLKNFLGFQTEVEFELPKGYVDGNGVLHRRGVMRLATAADEITPLRDPRVQQNPAYLAIIVLSRVVTRLGTVPDIGPNVIEGLFAADLDYLQRLYERINSAEESEIAAAPGVAVRTEPALNGRGFRTVGEA